MGLLTGTYIQRVSENYHENFGPDLTKIIANIDDMFVPIGLAFG